jgi:hypothetical protein
MAGAPKGNKNAVKSKPWEDALRRALSRAGNSVQKGLNPIADKVVALAMDGDLDAIREIACRLDGKPTEHVHIEQDLTVHVGDSLALAPALGKALELRTKPTVQ